MMDLRKSPPLPRYRSSAKDWHGNSRKRNIFYQSGASERHGVKSEVTDLARTAAAVECFLRVLRTIARK